MQVKWKSQQNINIFQSSSVDKNVCLYNLNDKVHIYAKLNFFQL